MKEKTRKIMRHIAEMVIAKTDNTWFTEQVELTEDQWVSEDCEYVASLIILEKYKDKNDIAFVKLYSTYEMDE